MLEWFLTGLFVASGAAYIWGIYCTNIAYRDKMRMNEVIFSHGEWQKLLTMADRVSFDRHMWARFFFRDPFRLYDPRLIEIMESRT